MPRTEAWRRPVGVEPDVAAVGLGEAHLAPVQQDQALAADAHDARRRAHYALGRLALDGIPVLGSEHGKRPDGLVGEEYRTQREPAGLGGEPGRDLCRADPAVIETSLLGGVTAQSPEVERGAPAHRGVERGHAGGDAEEEARLFVGDDDPAARVQRGDRLTGPRARLGERGGQLDAAVAGALAQERARRSPRWTASLLPARAGRGAKSRRRGPRRGRRSRGRGRPGGTDPLVESVAPVLRPADQHRSGRLQRGAPSRSSRSPTPTSTTTAPCCTPARGAACSDRPGRSGSGLRHR